MTTYAFPLSRLGSGPMRPMTSHLSLLPSSYQTGFSTPVSMSYCRTASLPWVLPHEVTDCVLHGPQSGSRAIRQKFNTKGARNA